MLNTERQMFSYDAATGVIDTPASTDDTAELHLDSMETTVVDDPPHRHAFDTDTFVTIDATVARPVPQDYDEGTFLKPADELAKAAWSLDNRPWTMHHPSTGVVKDVRDVRGFWRHAEYDEDDDELRASLYVPANDDEALDFLAEHRALSIGFWNTRVESYDGHLTTTDSSVEADDYDAYQVDLIIDHCASVRSGRCSIEQGCGLHVAVDNSVGTLDVTVDETTSVMTMEAQTHEQGSWVEWDASGGTAYGKIVDTVTEGCTTRGKGDMEVCAKDDDPVAIVEVYDNESGGSKDEEVRHLMSELRSWDGPTTDCSLHCTHSGHDDACACGMHVPLLDEHGDMDMEPPEQAQQNAQMALDAREDTGNPNDCGTETGWRHAEQIASGDELSWDLIADMSQFERHESNSEQGEDGRADCGWMMWKAWGGDAGVNWAGRMMDARQEHESDAAPDTQYDIDKTVAGVTFTGTSDGKLDESAIPNDDYEQHYLYPEDTKSDSSYPVVDADGNLRRGNVEAAYSLGARGGVDSEEHDRKLRQLNDEFDNPPIEFEEDTNTDTGTTMDDESNGNESGTTIDLDVSDLSVDALAERDERVAELQSDSEALSEVRETLDLDADEAAATVVEQLVEDYEELEADLASYREDERAEVIETIEQFTDRYEDQYDEMSLDELRDKADELETLAADVSNVDVDTGGDESGDGGAGVTSVSGMTRVWAGDRRSDV
jgi:hypothetical protein